MVRAWLRRPRLGVAASGRGVRRVWHRVRRGGGGIQGGISYGESDEWSFKAARDATYCYDLHATILHQLGINHEKLTYLFQGRPFRLTDVSGKVISEIIA